MKSLFNRVVLFSVCTVGFVSFVSAADQAKRPTPHEYSNEEKGKQEKSISLLPLGDWIYLDNFSFGSEEIRIEQPNSTQPIHVLNETYTPVEAIVKGADYIRWTLYPTDSNEPIAHFYDTSAAPVYSFNWVNVPTETRRLVLSGKVVDEPWEEIQSFYVRGESGEVQKASSSAQGLIATMPEQQKELKETLAQYLTLTSEGKFSQAWSYLHPTSKEESSSYTADEIRKRYLSQSSTSSASEVVGVQLYNQLTIPGCECTESSVAEVIVQMTNGKTTSFYAKQDENGEWKLLWSYGE
ncbi:hypothetical protein N781_04675 [Pontibacillus halophilus JSM 076056 = DSM 19796]|uniref:Uncharacterized protein n=1 Tax=Pontibacillus halophilus JSM 076056 = DSM 19796 TaxID=1385510 RepID=A0A0A5GJS2_9BACI|nr:hypothetical protein [Pontibacillus halophilus]KGX91410.1 hypothetical protein N781_04675 [Pontibacillus halophilus JSM 076056 = DSM 19796]